MLFGEEGILWCGKWGGIPPPPSPQLQGFPQTVDLEEEAAQSMHGAGNKQNEKRGNIFGKIGNAGGILQGDNSAGHFFVLRDLIPLNFFQ